MTSKLAVIFALMLSGASAAQTPVVLELFTSEGCSSCPPAEELFAKLADEPGVIALAFHVDYWNKLGWTDPFSKVDWSRRQSRWSGALGTEELYTPMLIAGGLGHVVASDEKKVRELVDRARRTQAKVLPLSVSKPAGGKLKAVVNIDDSEDDEAKFELVLFEDGLTTDVKTGENAGRQLSHRRVVRALAEGKAAEFALDPAWKLDRLGVAAIAHDARMKVLGAAQAKP